MDNNPMVKPEIATTPLVAGSSIVAVCLAIVTGVVFAGWPPAPWLTALWSIIIVIAALFALRWVLVTGRKKRWNHFANQQWQHLAEVKAGRQTTTEITILEFLDVQPTGAWATIRWERFGYTQPAWIENCPFALWPGSVLLISPDPSQINVGAPWPHTYYLGAARCYAIAPVMH